jgi:hypothetical protein
MDIGVGGNMAGSARDVILDRIEDEEDARAIADHRRDPDHTTYTMEQVGRMIGVM